MTADIAALVPRLGALFAAVRNRRTASDLHNRGNFRSASRVAILPHAAFMAGNASLCRTKANPYA
ncbi:hypothetical protein [Anatilimnocola floriformis]|uniref:hypothetical protein n=1 Tax=Anatilimnocola floriformis TaxID=2948575 RepID=UPI0020C1C5EE|nr:hypothetical protein [Anatilimnocola floriformis]